MLASFLLFTVHQKWLLNNENYWSNFLSKIQLRNGNHCELRKIKHNLMNDVSRIDAVQSTNCQLDYLHVASFCVASSGNSEKNHLFEIHKMMESTVLDTLHVMHDFVIALLFPLFFLYFLYVTILYYTYIETHAYTHTPSKSTILLFFALLSVARQVCNKEKNVIFTVCIYRHILIWRLNNDLQSNERKTQMETDFFYSRPEELSVQHPFRESMGRHFVYIGCYLNAKINVALALW